MNEKIVKRALDLSGAVVGLLLGTPLMVVSGLCIRVTMGRPVLFRQRRIGLGEVAFILLKFRTMNITTACDGKLLPDELRLTKLGRLLRAFSFDELPQLWNVLRGEMSLVGPRPLLPEYLGRYDAIQGRRHEIKPGITGWAQVNGRNALSWEQKFELDVWYVDHHSFCLDLKIIWLTLWTVVRRDAVSREGHATMPEFLGPGADHSRDQLV